MSFKRNESRTFYASVSSVNLKQKSRKITEKFVLQHHNLHLKIGRNSSHSEDIFLQFKENIQDSSLNFTFSVKNKESFLRHRALMTLKTSFALKRTSWGGRNGRVSPLFALTRLSLLTKASKKSQLEVFSLRRKRWEKNSSSIFFISWRSIIDFVSKKCL